MNHASEYTVFANWFGENLFSINPLNAELKPTCHLLAILGAHHIFHVSGLRVNDHCVTYFAFHFSSFRYTEMNISVYYYYHHHHHHHHHHHLLYAGYLYS